MPRIFILIALLGLLVPVAGHAEVLDEPAPRFDQSKAFKILGDAVERFDEIANLPESRWFGRDQHSAERAIARLIDDAIAVLDLPDIGSLRQTYRDVEAGIAGERSRISELRERRIFAQDTDESTLTRFTPTETLRNFTATTRGDYDRLIEARQRNIVAYEQELDTIKTRLSTALSAIGIDMPPDQLELWLSSAIGDDVVSMGVVFQSIRAVTQRLEELTRDSGENLDFAKRYYGMVVILHKLVVTMQKRFISRVDEDILPSLKQYRDEADELIAESRTLLRAGGNRASLESNIAANELTKRAIDLYTRIVQSQRKKVADALRVSEREEQVAINTYRTVRLSASVADLVRDGANTFETLSSLQVPDAAEFQNEEIREEFRRLTERLERN